MGRGYDAVDVIEKIKKLGWIPVVGIRQAQRKETKDDLRKEWLEGGGGKSTLAIAVLWGFYMLAVYLFCLFILRVSVVPFSWRGSLMHRVF